MTLTALFISSVVSAVPAVAFGYWWRGRADAQAAKYLPAANSAASGGEAVARLEIQLNGTVVSTDVCVDLQQLEHLANGCGRTLTELPSTARH